MKFIMKWIQDKEYSDSKNFIIYEDEDKALLMRPAFLEDDTDEPFYWFDDSLKHFKLIYEYIDYKPSENWYRKLIDDVFKTLKDWID